MGRLGSSLDVPQPVRVILVSFWTMRDCEILTMAHQLQL